MSSEERIVVPGEKLAVIEEALPGPGTYEEGGVIRASKLGLLTEEGGRLSVRGFKDTVLPLQEGEEVLGVVWYNEVRLSFVRVVAVVKPRRALLKNPLTAIMLRSDPANRNVKPGDLILARVEDSRWGQVVLTLRGSRYGVVRALCPTCRRLLKRVGYALVCEECGRPILDRKVSDLYGSFEGRWLSLYEEE